MNTSLQPRAIQKRQPTVFKQKSEISLIHNPEHREKVEAFIQRCFNRDYGADVHSFADNLLALSDKEKRVMAAFGYHNAANRYLFLEQYLDHPIEAVLAQNGCGCVQRNQILEVGNLASASSGSTRRLILSLITYFYQQGFRWLVITITPRVLNTFQKLGVDLDLIPLAEACSEKLQTTRDDWGSYYEHQPIVYAGNIERALQRFENIPLIASLIEQAEMPKPDHFLTLE